jgi:hypothetical protein
MKKSIGLLVASLLLSGAVFTSCKSNAEKVEEEQEDVVNAKEDEMDAQQNIIEAKSLLSRLKQAEIQLVRIKFIDIIVI